MASEKKLSASKTEKILIVTAALGLLLVVGLIAGSGISGYITRSADSTVEAPEAPSENTAVEPAKALIGYWNFDESSGTELLDSSGNANHGSRHSAPRVEGILGGGAALAFGGVRDYAYVPAKGARTDNVPFTVTAWFKSSSSYNGPLWMWGDSLTPDTSARGESPVGWRASSGKLAAGFYSRGHNYAEASDDYADGKWHFVAQVSDGTSGYLYIDGVLAATTEHTYKYASAPYLILGARSRNGSSEIDDHPYFSGSLDELKVYNYALSADEVNAEFAKNQ